MTARDWSIQEIARLAGTTSRTLRHYDDIDLLPPSRVGPNGYRHYDELALVRLQRILLLRDLGLGLPQIKDVLASATDCGGREAAALETHLALLREEQNRLARQIASVESTIEALKGGEQLMAENMFDGFDHTQHREEVEQRWGKKAYADSDRWWRGMTDADRADWKRRVAALNRDWIAAAESGIDPASDEAQDIARRHVEWLTGIPGTPAALRQAQGPRAALRQAQGPRTDAQGPRTDAQGPRTDAQRPRTDAQGPRAYVLGLGEMYVADPRFSANYGGTSGAEFVRDTLRVYAEANL